MTDCPSWASLGAMSHADAVEHNGRTEGFNVHVEFTHSAELTH